MEVSVCVQQDLNKAPEDGLAVLKVQLEQLARKAEKRDLTTHELHAKPCFKKMKKRGWKRRARHKL
jgi:hypothetical protein